MNFPERTAGFLILVSMVSLSVSATFGQGRVDEPVIQIGLVRDESVVRNGEPLVVRVTLRNTTNKAIPLSNLPIFEIERVGSSSDKASRDGRSMYAAARLPEESEYMDTKALEPGRSMEFEIDLAELQWNRKGSSILGNSRLAKSLESGTYRLMAELPIEIEADPQTKAPRFERLRSNVIEFNYRK